MVPGLAGLIMTSRLELYLQRRRWWAGSGMDVLWTAGPLESSCTSCEWMGKQRLTARWRGGLCPWPSWVTLPFGPYAGFQGTRLSMRRWRKMTTRTMTRTSSARSLLATMNLTLRTGMTSPRRVRRCPASGDSEGLVWGTCSQPPLPDSAPTPQPIHHL